MGSNPCGSFQIYDSVGLFNSQIKPPAYGILRGFLPFMDFWKQHKQRIRLPESYSDLEIMNRATPDIKGARWKVEDFSQKPRIGLKLSDSERWSKMIHRLIKPEVHRFSRLNCYQTYCLKHGQSEHCIFKSLFGQSLQSMDPLQDFRKLTFR